MLWTRRDLKDYAKDFLRKHYWKAFIVCLIFTLLTNSGNDQESNVGVEYYEDPMIVNQYYFEDNNIINAGANSFVRVISLFFKFPFWLIGASTIAFITLIIFIISIIIGPLIIVGKNRFFLEGFKGDVKISYLFSTFNSQEFWGIFKCMFITNIKIFLWTLLFIIPGIIKSYEYYMVSYLLSENPNLTSREAIEISRELTYGHKLDIFILELSFLGWYFLGALFFGIGTFFVVPYEEAAKARLFNVLSGNGHSNGDYHIAYE